MAIRKSDIQAMMKNSTLIMASSDVIERLVNNGCLEQRCKGESCDYYLTAKGKRVRNSWHKLNK